jgi:putative endonuclease
MTSPHAAKGHHWENEASTYLRAQGLSVIARGYRCRQGELDIVLSDGSSLVVCEVRARSSRALVSAKESVDRRKRARILQATRHFLMRHPQYHDRSLRFDVIAIDAIDTANPRIEWIKSAFDTS